MTHMFTYLTSPRNGEANGEDLLEAHGLIFVSANFFFFKLKLFNFVADVLKKIHDF